MIHRDRASHFVDIYSGRRSYDASLLEQILAMVTTGVSPIDPEETIEIIRFIERRMKAGKRGKPSACSFG